MHNTAQSFTCSACDEVTPASFRFTYHAQELCPNCVQFWATQAAETMKRAEAADAERAASRIAELYRRRPA